MELIKRNGSVCVMFDIKDKKISDKFDFSGTIGIIIFVVKSNERGYGMKMKIGETIFADKELVNENQSLQLQNKITFRKEISFTKGDIFEFEQIMDNVSQIYLWFAALKDN